MKQEVKWRGTASSELTCRSEALARQLGEQLRDRRILEFFQSNDDWSLSSGSSGVALALDWLDRCFPNEGWAESASRFLLSAAKSFEKNARAGMHPGLFGGVSGIAFAANSLSRDGCRYSNLVHTLHSLTTRIGNEFISRVSQYTEFSPSDYDIISGISGIGAYASSVLDFPEALQLLNKCVGFFVESLDFSPPHLRFFIPPHLIQSPRMAEVYPSGYVDCGLAHGLPSPLAFLSIAKLSGCQYDGLVLAITNFSEWLIDNSFETQSGKQWPSGVGCESASKNRLPTRAAWCYGNPGIARSLWLAGKALDCQRIKDIAIDSINAVFRSSRESWQIDSPMFCHGWAGLLHIVMRFDNEIQDDAFSYATVDLINDFLSQLEEYPVLDLNNSTRLVTPGLLEGAAGILLVLISVSSHLDPSWDRLMLTN